MLRILCFHVYFFFILQYFTGRIILCSIPQHTIKMMVHGVVGVYTLCSWLKHVKHKISIFFVCNGWWDGFFLLWLLVVLLILVNVNFKVLICNKRLIWWNCFWYGWSQKNDESLRDWRSRTRQYTIYMALIG